MLGIGQHKLYPPWQSLSNDKKAFPDALLHNLLLSLTHPDYETRVGAHSILSTILMPSLIPRSSREGTSLSMVSNVPLQGTSGKSSNHTSPLRCFQLALSPRSISFDDGGGFQPSRRRSIYTLATCMLIFAARAGSLPELVSFIKTLLTEKTIDPYLELIDDSRLQAVYIPPAGIATEKDEASVQKSLLEIGSDDQQFKQTIFSHLTDKFEHLPEDELSNLRRKFLQAFSPDEAYPMGAPLFMDTSKPCSPLAQIDFLAFEDDLPRAGFTDDDPFLEPCGSQSDSKSSLSSNNMDIISVNQLLASVLETACQVANMPVSSTPIAYDQMKSQCEALVTGKQLKMSVLHSFKIGEETRAIILSCGSARDLPIPDLGFEMSEDMLFIDKDRSLG